MLIAVNESPASSVRTWNTTVLIRTAYCRSSQGCEDSVLAQIDSTWPGFDHLDPAQKVSSQFSNSKDPFSAIFRFDPS